jgi:choline dehydrogenase
MVKTKKVLGMYDVTIHKGERASVSKYYLNPAKKRKNLKVFTEAFVEKIIFDGKKAIGIEVKIKDKVEKIYANKEVILSGGRNKLSTIINACQVWVQANILKIKV